MRTATRTRNVLNAAAQKRGVTVVSQREIVAEREDLRTRMDDLGSMTENEVAAYRTEFDEFESATVADGLSK